MQKTTSIKLKAAILFIVFALNSVRSLSCALNFDRIVDKITDSISFSNETNTDIAKSSLDIDTADDENYHHGNKKCQCKHDHCDSEKDDCCDAKVVSFDQLDKIITKTEKANFELPRFTSPSFSLLFASICSDIHIALNYNILRKIHPPYADIRVLIQSLQI